MKTAKEPAFRYKVNRMPILPLPFGKPRSEDPEEYLSGFVDGKPASDIEERFAKALRKQKRVTSFEFLVPVIGPRNAPGSLQLDFLITCGAILMPVQIDGEYAHYGEAKKQSDYNKDIQVNAWLRKYNALPVKRIDGKFLKTQDMADTVVGELVI